METPQIKIAETEAPIHPYLAERFSPRAFADKAVPKEMLRRLMEAARWAPSSANEQPWHFILGMKGDKTWEKIYAGLDDGNRLWCDQAPVLMVTVAARQFKRNGRENVHARHDIGQAISHLTFQACHEGVYVHQMAGFYADVFSESFHIPETHEPVTAVAIGYLGDPDTLDEKNYRTETTARQRKEVREFVFAQTWDHPFSF